MSSSAIDDRLPGSVVSDLSAAVRVHYRNVALPARQMCGRAATPSVYTGGC